MLSTPINVSLIWDESLLRSFIWLSNGPRIIIIILVSAPPSQYFLCLSLAASPLSSKERLCFNSCFNASREPSNFLTSSLNFVLFNIASSLIHISTMSFIILSSSIFTILYLNKRWQIFLVIIIIQSEKVPKTIDPSFPSHILKFFGSYC